jgi:hypothetical protein
MNLEDARCDKLKWTAEGFAGPDYYQTLAASGEITMSPKGLADSFDPNEPGVQKRVHRSPTSRNQASFGKSVASIT